MVPGSSKRRCSLVQAVELSLLDHRMSRAKTQVWGQRLPREFAKEEVCAGCRRVRELGDLGAADVSLRFGAAPEA